VCRLPSQGKFAGRREPRPPCFKKNLNKTFLPRFSHPDLNRPFPIPIFLAAHPTAAGNAALSLSRLLLHAPPPLCMHVYPLPLNAPTSVPSQERWSATRGDDPHRRAYLIDRAAQRARALGQQRCPSHSDPFSPGSFLPARPTVPPRDSRRLLPKVDSAVLACAAPRRFPCTSPRGVAG
jgi:hypothetical protein